MSEQKPNGQDLNMGEEAQVLFEELKANPKAEVVKSPTSNSVYIMMGEYIYRYSDHWGRVASCYWSLDKGLAPWQIKRGYWVLAKCLLRHFKQK